MAFETVARHRWVLAKDVFRYKEVQSRIRARLERSAKGGESVPVEQAFDRIKALHQQQVAGDNEKR